MEDIKFSNGMMAIPTELEDCYILEPRVFGDERGYFSPYFLQEYMKELGFKGVVQTNRSLSSKGVFRGYHFQKNPGAQAKIVEVLTGAAVDIVIDIRKNSPTYGKGTAVLLTPYDPKVPGSGRQLFVPRGFAHGFISLKDNTLFQYIIDNDYNPSLEDGIQCNDKDIEYLLDGVLSKYGEKYGISREQILLSEKDKERTPLKDIEDHFIYEKKLK